MSDATPRLATVSMTAPDARELGTFYLRLLGWELGREEADWMIIRPPGGGTALSFQTEAGYERPVWPDEPGEQQLMMHLDLAVEDLDQAGARAAELGATLASTQPQAGVSVWLDPAGHPFCLFLAGH